MYIKECLPKRESHLWEICKAAFTIFPCVTGVVSPFPNKGLPGIVIKQ